MLSWVVLNFLVAVLLPYCTAEGHFQNVALHRPCNQSSFDPGNIHQCSAALNGDTSGRYNVPSTNCIHTDGLDWTPSLVVDLGQSYMMHHIVVWARDEEDPLKIRMSGCEIKVNDRLCYTFGNVSASDNRTFVVTCGQHLSGQFIRVEKHTSSAIPGGWNYQYSLNMCEFQVYANYVCSDGYWGSECDNTCGRCSSGQSCDGQTGNCTAGCAAGTPPHCTDFVDGQWGSWGGYGTCNVTCGGGSQTRIRHCDNPAPAKGGADCSGANSETRPCNNVTCPVNGQWGLWGSWGTCSKTCGGGSQSRSRQCDHPAPANGGANCLGNGTDSQACNAHPCPVNGHWGQWQSWGTCSVTCGGGSQSRSRQCDHPAPAHNGAYCPGNGTESQACNALLCQPESLTAVSAAVIGGAAVGGALVTAAIGAVIFFVRRRVRRNGRDTKMHGGRGTRKTTRRSLPHTRLSTDTVYEDVTGLGTVAVAGAGASPTSPAAAATSRTTDVYENVGNSSYEAPSNYETLDLSTLGQRSVYTVMKTYKK